MVVQYPLFFAVYFSVSRC